MPKIYTSIARTTKPMRETTVPSYIEAFKLWAKNVPFVPYPTDEMHEVTIYGEKEIIDDKTYKKQFKLRGFIGGEMLPGCGHNDEAVVFRDILPLDFDEIKDEEAFLNKIKHIAEDRDYSLIMYKTFSYKEGNPRYRVLFPLDRPVTKEEYVSLLIGVPISIDEVVDPKSRPWSQLAFLPVMTEFNQEDFIQVAEGRPLPVDGFLARILKNDLFKEAKKELEKPADYGKARPKHKTPLGGYIDKLVEGTGDTHDFDNFQNYLVNIGATPDERILWAEYFSEMNAYDFTNVVDTRSRPGKRGARALNFADVISGLDDTGINRVDSKGNKVGRNSTLFAFGMFLADNRVEAENLKFLIDDLNNKNTPPLQNSEISQILFSVMK